MDLKFLLKRFLLLLSFLRLWPHILLLLCLDVRKSIRADVDRWSAVCFGSAENKHWLFSFVKLMTLYPEYRNLFYYRAGWQARLLRVFCRPVSTLFINAKNIGPGLFIQHGFATIIVADEIGGNCWINQQVTIGYSADEVCPPRIGNNVIINAGAKIIGDVTIGDNSIIGANAVVVKNVPSNVTVVGVPARIVRRNGKRVNEELSGAEQKADSTLKCNFCERI